MKPLAITCTSSNCSDGLHCFKQTRKMKAANETGRCRSCGIELVDWERVQKNDLGDVQYAFSMLRHEMIRHHFWHLAIDQRAMNHALRKGRSDLVHGVEARIRRSVGLAEPFRDGRQTPKEGNVVYYAQHATASCCRKCIEYWHGIEQGRELRESEIDYLTQLVIRYIDERLPNLPDIGQRIPHLRTGPEQTMQTDTEGQDEY